MSGTKSLFQRPLDLLFVIYFIIHIPITPFIDSQAVINRDWQPKLTFDAVDWYSTDLGDDLMRNSPPWYQSFIWCEIFFQWPFFFFAIYAFVQGRNWIRIPAIIYGSHVTTTLIPILAEIWFSRTPHWQNLPTQKKAILTLIYSPFLLIPVLLTLKMAFNPLPFGNNKEDEKIKHKKK
eukprot:TRINITY_DN3738_c0_g1_i1.p1 TRINITY_DN3738_c0_g1~~TRINITY_DN3738_c0_g1_i1.p1  ORF type:complete len:178 (-),score=41.83 TRINITY_DN3738_c0_g1_i1:107-640(-)